MDAVEFRLSQSASRFGLSAVLAGVVVVAFWVSQSLWGGLVALIVVALIAPSAIRNHNAYFSGQSPAVLTVSLAGICIGRGPHHGVEISWADVDDVGLIKVRRQGSTLGVRVRGAENYLSGFDRINLMFEYFQIKVPLAGLDHSPSDIFNVVREFRRQSGQAAVQRDGP